MRWAPSATTAGLRAPHPIRDAARSIRGSLKDFLWARIERVGAEGYVEVFDLFGGREDVPLLYATTTGAPYERSEIEQLISLCFENGRPTLRLDVGNTTENGQPLSES